MTPADMVRTGVEVLILAALIYAFFRFLQATRGSAVLKGFIMLLVAVAVGFVTIVDQLGLYHLRHLAEGRITIVIMSLVVLFQPELRQALVKLGENRLMRRLGRTAPDESVIDEVVLAARRMARSSTGAIIVLERSAGIAAFTERGTELDARVSATLLLAIFHKNAPLHDGAVLIRDGRIAAAGCLLPLSENDTLSKTLGTRHRAGLGITEESDAVAVIVSEETGRISVARDGQLELNISSERLQEILGEEPSQVGRSKEAVR